MADQKFLAHIEDIRLGYLPMPAEVTEARIRLPRNAMVEIGSLLDHRNAHARQIIEKLRLLCMSALDMVQSDDYDKLFESIVDLHIRKNAGYAGLYTKDPWANFRMAEWFHVSPFVGCLIRMSDKLIRIKNLSDHPEADQVQESITDALYDLAIYAVIAICLLEQEISGAGMSIMTI